MILVSDHMKKVYQNLSRQLIEDLSGSLRIHIEPTYENGYKVKCPNCINSLHDESFNVFDSTFTSSTTVFSGTSCERTISPTSFSGRARCPICLGIGELTCDYKVDINANVNLNPRSVYDMTSAGREGSKQIVLAKVHSCHYDLIMDASYFELDGMKYELNRPPTIKKFGGVETLVWIYLEATEVGSRVREDV